MKEILFLFLTLLSTHWMAAHSGAEVDYLLFDESRMLCYEYDATPEADLKPFVDYHMRMEPGKRIIFRVDPSQKKTISMPPQKIYEAGDTELFKPKFREAVNKSFKEMAVITVKGAGYISQPVQEIILFEESGNAIEFKDRTLSFRYNFDYTYGNGENLRFDANGYGTLFFLNKGKEDCLERRTFRFHGELSSDVYKNITFLSKIGLWSITEGASEDGIYLNKVNALTAQAFVQQICSTGEIFPSPEGSIEKPSIGEVLAKKEASETPPPPAAKTNVTPSSTTKKSAADTTKPKEFFPAPKTVTPWEMSNTNANTGNSDPKKPASNYKPQEWSPVPAGYHRVKTGETVSSISLKYGIAEDCFIEANNLKDDRIKVGQDLLVAIGEDYNCPMPYKWVEDKPNNRMLLYHIVHRGDDLYKIAKTYNTTVEQLQAWNQLTNSDILRVRQELLVRIKEEK